MSFFLYSKGAVKAKAHKGGEEKYIIKHRLLEKRRTLETASRYRSQSCCRTPNTCRGESSLLM